LFFRGENAFTEKLSDRIVHVIPGPSAKLVSIICPVTNMAGRLQKLEKWICELAGNSRVEVVVIHDFYDEATRKELKAVCEKYKLVNFIEGQYGNPGSARNAGLEVCSGKWIAFWDCDDEPDTREFLLLIGEIERSNPDICFSRFSTLDENSGAITASNPWSSTQEENLRVIAHNPGIWRTVFSRELLQGISFRPLRMAEDQIFMCEAVVKASKIIFFNNLIYVYFIGSDHHLTKNTSALQDLLPAFNQTSGMVGKGKAELSPFLLLMAVRQFISGLKFGTMRTRLGLVGSICRSGLLFRPVFLATIFTSVSNSRRVD
jgi:glycosyltransferase involved in cell wall biosynthesis